MRTLLLAGLVLGLAPAMAVADAMEPGDWLLRVGYHTVNPKGDNASVLGGTDNLQVRQDNALTFNLSYFLTGNVAVELQAATPFNHDISVAGAGHVASTRQLPPTLNLQYHLSFGAFKPYVGAGINWTIFFDEKTTGALAGTDLSLDDSFGADIQAGLDYEIGGDWYLNGEVRWIDIDTDAELDGVALAEVEIDPFVYALSVGRRF